MKILHKLLAKILYSLGKRMGSYAKYRPDIPHEFLLGFRDGLHTHGVKSPMVGDMAWALWRRWYHNLRNTDSPPIPFRSLMDAPSGSGKRTDGAI